MPRKIDRRDFLKGLSAASLGTLIAGAPRPLLAEQGPAEQDGRPAGLRQGRADAVILLWMAGGMPHTDSFDPKHHQPFVKGMRQYTLQSTFPAIDTSVDGVKISAGLEHLAQVMDRGTILRSFVPSDLGHILHSRHQYHWHTGYAPPQTIEPPHIGSTILKTLGTRNPDLPGFVHIGQRLGIEGASEVQAYLTAGFHGSEFAPYLMSDAANAYRAMQPAPGMEAGRFRNRHNLFRRLLDESPAGLYGSDYHRESMLRSMENSYRMMNAPSVKAFDLREERKEVYDSYATGNFGLGCLLARRLVESGVRFVEVTTENIPFGNWDTHDDGFRRISEMKRLVDAPIARLVLDLEERGMLERTLVVVATEFSRNAAVKPENRDPHDKSLVLFRRQQFGLHRHFTGAASLLFFGGGFRRGHVHGRTSDAAPNPVIEHPVPLMDVHATIFEVLGIPANHGYVVEQRPFYVTEDGKGKPIAQLLV